MLLNLPISYSFWKFFLHPPNILEIIPTKIDLLSNILANLANQHKEDHNQLQITTLNRHEMLSTEKYFLNCSHVNGKLCDCGFKVRPVKVYNGLGSRTKTLIVTIF